MMKIRIFLACLVCRAARALLHLSGRGGTSLPGKLALRLCPDILNRVSAGVESVLVTGTNGKTTTAKLLTALLEGQGVPVFSNRSGANLAAGITAEYILHAGLSGRPKQRYAVIECDEAALKQVSGRIRPRVILVSNVFRDQPDRYGDESHTLEEIREGIRRAPEAALCLNADCPLTASLGAEREAPLFFGMEAGAAGALHGVRRGRCPRCGSLLDYEYQSFDIQGGFRCPGCGYARPEPRMKLLSAELREDSSRALLSWDGAELPLTLSLPSLFNLVNAAAALSAAAALGFEPRDCAPALASAEAGFGRMESLQIGETPLRFILIKNTAGCDRALDYLRSLPEPCRLILGLNDREADGTDVGWIWDCGFEELLAEAPPTALAVYGSRAGDLRLRLKYAGVPDESICALGSAAELRDWIAAEKSPVCLLPNYSVMLELRDSLARGSGKGRFWE